MKTARANLRVVVYWWQFDEGQNSRPTWTPFEAMMMRKDCEKGSLISFASSSDALSEISQFFKRTAKVIIPLTVREILDEEIARKLV